MSIIDNLSAQTEELKNKVEDLGGEIQEETPIDEPSIPGEATSWTDALTGGIFEHVKKILKISWDIQMGDTAKHLPELYDVTNDWMAENVTGPFNSFAQNWINDILNADWLSDDAKKVLRKSQTGLVGLDVVLINFALAGVLGLIVSAHLGIGVEKITQRAKADDPITLPDISSAVIALWKNPDIKNAIEDIRERSGISKERWEVLQSALAPILDPNIIRQLSLRGEISESETVSLLKKSGLSEDQIELSRKIWQWIPPAQDLIRFAVREAFSPDIVSKYDTHADLPADFVSNLKKTGGSEEWAKAYWASHWELPSIQMGFQMLHRGVIDNEELNTLLRTKDIMPYWREKTTAISYTPFTRVDIRRMHALGVLDDKGVLKAYTDIGYSPENAEKMLEFTIQLNMESEFDLTRTEVLKAFRSEILSEKETIAFLSSLGYSEERVSLIMTLESLKEEESVRDLTLSQVKNLYKEELIRESEVYEKLSALNMGGNEIDLLIKYWNLEKPAKAKKLTLGMIVNLFKKGIIDVNTLESEIGLLGYSETRTNWLVKYYTTTLRR